MENEKRLIDGMPQDSYLQEQIDTLEGLENDVLEKLQEMRQILQDVERRTGNTGILARAEAYWLAHVSAALEGSNPYDISLERTIDEIRGEMDSPDYSEER